MKKQKDYTFLFIKNNSSDTKQITLTQKSAKIILFTVALFFLTLSAFLTHYFSLNIDQWKLTQLEKENHKIIQEFAFVENQLQDLETKVQQISDFSKKLHTITNIHSTHSSKSIGKIHTNSSILTLSKPSTYKKTNRSLATKKENKPINQSFNSKNLELRIEKLTGETEWVKQNSWTLYTDLLEKKELLNNTPSIVPTKGWVSSQFGYRNETVYTDHEPYFHRGIDIAAVEGNPVFSSADGKVVFTGYDESGFGNLIIVDHGYGLKTYYAHLSEIKTKIGKKVQKAEVIASVGNTGRSSGSHLHYEVRIFNVPVNPENYILDQSLLLLTNSEF